MEFTILKEPGNRYPLIPYREDDFRKAGRIVFWQEVGCEAPMKFDTMEQAVAWLEAFLKEYDHVPRKWMRVVDLEEVQRLEASRKQPQ